MTIWHRGEEYPEEVGGQRYPFTDDSSLTAVTGLQLPSQAFLDALICPPGASPDLWLQELTLTPTGGSLRIGDATQTWATGTFSMRTDVTSIPLQDAVGRYAGDLLTDPVGFALIQAKERAVHAFSSTARFLPSCVLSSLAQVVSGIQLESGEVFTGEVWLVAEDGVVIRSTDYDTLRVDVVGDPLFARRLCTPVDLFTPPRALKTINGQAGNVYGQTTLIPLNTQAGNTPLRVRVEGAQLIIGLTAGGALGRPA